MSEGLLSRDLVLSFWLDCGDNSNCSTLKKIINLADSVDQQIIVWKKTKKNEPLHIWAKWKISRNYSFREMENLYFEYLNVDEQVSQLLLTGMLLKRRGIEDLIFIVDRMEEINGDYDIASRWLIEEGKYTPRLLRNIFLDNDDYLDFFRENPMVLKPREFWVALSKKIPKDSKYGRLVKKGLLYYGIGM